MTQRYNTVAKDVLLFVGVAGALVTAALLSPRFARPGTATTSDVPQPAIERRDFFLGAAEAEDSLWMTGSGGKIVRSTDGGRTWAIQGTGLAQDLLQDIAAWDANHAVAVGDQGVVVITSDGGAHWRAVPAPRSEIASKLLRVRTAPGGTAWAVGVMGTVLRSTDWGETWDRRAPEADRAWNDIALIEGGRVIVVVGEFGGVMRSTDQGESWEERPTPTERSLMGVAFRNEHEGIAAGLDGTLLHTTDSGRTWKLLPAVTDRHLFAVAWVGDRWIAAGDLGTVLVASGATPSDWGSGTFASGSFAWHTELLPVGEALLAVGVTQGFWDPESRSWNPIGTESAEG